jgi:hypothetical protein
LLFLTVYTTTDWKDESRSALLRAAYEAKQQAAVTATTAATADTADAAATEVFVSTSTRATMLLYVI